jgi:DNA-directed RNA polymerase subunit RPC12/RpoP
MLSDAYPGFTITCDKCGSKNVTFKSDMGYSPESGGWGGIQLFCADCKNEVEIYEN